MMAAGPEEALLGRWRTMNTTKGGIGAMYEFKTGGVVLVRPGAIVPGTWRIEGNEIVLPPMVEGGPELRQTVDFSQPGRLILRQGANTAMDLSRVGKAPAGKPTVVGEWTGMRAMDGGQLEMRIFFYANGKSLFLLPFTTQQAKYGLTDGRMFLTLPDGKTTEGPWSLTGNVLTIPGVRAGTSSKLVRY
jgi:hypothetical protein